MLERLLIVAVAVALLALAVALGRRWYAWRNRRIEARLRAEEAPGAHPSGARIVYFTTQTCVVCKAQQEPAIAAVLRRMGPAVRLERYDAVEERALADRYGVLSVPTTAVYDLSGDLITVNRGFAPAALLLAQLRGEAPSFESGAPMSSEALTEQH